MAVVLWKGGKSELCDPLMMGYQLDAGWSLTNEPKKEEVEKVIESKNPANEALEMLMEEAESLGVKFRNDIKYSTLDKKVKKAKEALDNDSN